MYVRAAGKGRSGTLACSYLLTLDETPSPPKLQRSMAKKEWAKRRADEVMDIIETEEVNADAKADEEQRVGNEKGTRIDIPGGREEPTDMPSITGKPTATTPPTMTPRTGSLVEESKLQTRPNSLEDVLALHTARRMRAPSDPEKKMKQGVSIPSQRRWLYYWSLILSRAAPPGFWELGGPSSKPIPRVRLREMKIRLRDVGGVKMNMVKLASKVIEKANSGKAGSAARGSGPIWVSLARYNDEFVERLEKWERQTRNDDGNLGKRRKGSQHVDEEDLAQLFKSDDWDKGKMIRSFARLGHVSGASGTESPKVRHGCQRALLIHPDYAAQVKEGDIVTHFLRPLSEQKLEVLKEQISKAPADVSKKLDPETKEAISDTTNAEPGSSNPSPLPSAMSSVADFTQNLDDKEAEKGVILDATREVRAKLFLGQVFMGWFWFIPTFHIPPPDDAAGMGPFSFTLTRKEVDFVVGAGTALVDVQVSMEWVRPPRTQDGKQELQPPKTQTSADSAKGVGGEPGTGDVTAKIVAGLEAAVEGVSGREAVEVGQAEDQ